LVSQAFILTLHDDVCLFFFPGSEGRSETCSAFRVD